MSVYLNQLGTLGTMAILAGILSVIALFIWGILFALRPSQPEGSHQEGESVKQSLSVSSRQDRLRITLETLEKNDSLFYGKRKVLQKLLEDAEQLNITTIKALESGNPSDIGESSTKLEKRDKLGVAVVVLMQNSHRRRALIPLVVLLTVGTGYLLQYVVSLPTSTTVAFPLTTLVTYALGFLLFVNLKVTEYRISRGLYGTNPHEAKQLIQFLLEESDGLNLPPGSKRKILVKPDEIRREVTGLADLQGAN